MTSDVFSVVVVDDEVLIAEYVAKVVEELGTTEVHVYTDAEGRIGAVADVFDALTTSRPYKKAWAFDAGLANLREEAGRLYDAECVEAFLDIQDAVREVAASISH